MKSNFISNRSVALLIGSIFIFSGVLAPVFGQKKTPPKKPKQEKKEEIFKAEYDVLLMDEFPKDAEHLSFNIKVKFDKNSKEVDFAKLKKELKEKFNIDFEYKDLKYNSDKQLIFAEISVKTQDGNSATYRTKEEKPVDPFGFIIRENEFRVGKIFPKSSGDELIIIDNYLDGQPYSVPHIRKRYRSKYEADNILLQDLGERLSGQIHELGEKVEKLEINLEKSLGNDVVIRENKQEEILYYYLNGKELDKSTFDDMMKNLDPKAVKMVVVAKHPKGGKSMEIITKDKNK